LSRRRLAEYMDAVSGRKRWLCWSSPFVTTSAPWRKFKDTMLVHPQGKYLVVEITCTNRMHKSP
jgi:hypothetical protein